MNTILESSGMHRFDLEERTFQFAKCVYLLCKKFPPNSIYQNQIEQIMRSAGSIGANYIEANEALGKKDFIMRLKIARKEAKEAAYWLKLLKETSNILSEEIQKLYDEVMELKRIFSSIILKFRF